MEKAINTTEVKDILATGERFFDEIKANDKFRDLLQSNVKYIDTLSFTSHLFNRFVADLKNIIVPFIQDQILVMKIPPVSGTKRI